MSNNDASTLVRELASAGVSLSETKDGWQALAENGDVVAVIHRSPSDRRWRANTIAQLRRAGLVDKQFGRDKAAAKNAAREARRARRAEGLLPLVMKEKGNRPYSAVAKSLLEFSYRNQRVLIARRRPDKGKKTDPFRLYTSTLQRWGGGASVPRTAFLDLVEDWLREVRMGVVLHQMVEKHVEPEPPALPEVPPVLSPVPELALELALRLQGDPAELLPLVRRVAELETRGGENDA